MSKEYLFIGGSHDGERIRIEDDRDYVTLRGPEKYVDTFLHNLKPEDRPPPNEDYRKRAIVSGIGSYVFLIANSDWRSEDLINHLIKNYCRITIEYEQRQEK